jgi:Uma2 family endonuclease
MGALRKPATGRMTVEDFLTCDSRDRSGRPCQLVDGVPLAIAPATTAHGAIQMELGRLSGNHLVASGRDCRVLGEPGVVPRVRARTNVRVPDIGVACGAPSAEKLLTELVLLIEILSPSTASETYANVWTYTTIPTVAEILILSSTARHGEILRRLADGNWPDAFDVIEPRANLTLDSIGFSFVLDDAYRMSGIAA